MSSRCSTEASASHSSSCEAIPQASATRARGARRPKASSSRRAPATNAGPSPRSPQSGPARGSASSGQERLRELRRKNARPEPGKTPSEKLLRGQGARSEDDEQVRCQWSRWRSRRSVCSVALGTTSWRAGERGERKSVARAARRRLTRSSLFAASFSLPVATYLDAAHGKTAPFSSPHARKEF